MKFYVRVMYYLLERLDFSFKNKLFMCIFLWNEFINFFFMSKMVIFVLKVKKLIFLIEFMVYGFKVIFSDF